MTDAATPAAAPAPVNYQALVDLVSLVCEVVNAVVALPKPLSAASLAGLLPLLPAIEALVPEAGQIPSELEQLDEATAVALLSKVGSTLNVGNAKAQAVVTEALQVAVAVVGLINAVKS